MDGGPGADDLVGTDGDDTISAGAGNDVVHGLGGNDTLNGDDGDDRLHGGPGSDSLSGGAGDDFLFVDADDVVIETDTGGYDQVLASTTYVLTAGAYVELLATTSNAGTTTIDLTGNELGQAIIGNAAANILRGGGGLDALVGLAGNDVFHVDADDMVYEEAGGGYDHVLASASYVLTAGTHVELLSTTSNAGTTTIDLTGNELGQAIIGNNGANVLRGGGGLDALVGLGGNDVLFVDGDDAVHEDAGGGYDQVLASASHNLSAGAHVELLATTSLSGTDSINLTGNALGQAIVGNAGANILNGGGGLDALVGLGGNDAYYVDADDMVYEDADAGQDQVLARESYVLAAGLSIEVLATADDTGTTAINLTGNALGQLIIGNNGANTLIGGGGDDLLAGLGGNDVLYVDFTDSVQEAVGGGSDQVLALTSFVLTAGAEVELLATTNNAGTANLNLTGNALGQALVGNAGGNVLDGEAGQDALVGLGGADAFVFSSALGPGNIDQIIDMTPGVDRIYLGGEWDQPFVALASGALNSGAFIIGAAALQPDDVIIYNSATGALLYDSDGNGAGAAVQFATIGTGLGLTAADFLVLGPANTLPVIGSGTTASIAENSSVSTIVYQTAASDPDADRVTFSLAGPDAGAFTIDANGAVRLVSPADFETKSSYSITVVASDSGPNPTLRSVTVSVVDVADASTPIINETAAANDDVASAQSLDRNGFAIVTNINLSNDDLPSATINGNISTPTDKDYFSITLQAGELLILDVDNTNVGNLDAVLRVFNAAGLELVSNDDPGSFDAGSSPGPYDHNTDSFVRWRAPADGVYYFSIESFQDPENPTSGSYQINVSVGPVATPAQILAEDVGALLSGVSWPGTHLTFAFPNAFTDFPAGFGDGEATATSGYQPFNGNQQAAALQMLDHISQVSGLTFQQIIDANGSSDGTANLRYAESDVPEVAYAYLPTGDAVGGSMWFNHTDFEDPRRGNYDWMGILHETGHALGLKHGHETPAISFDHDSLEYSVMTYRSYVGASVDAAGGYTNETWGYPQSLMMLDIAALQQLYGANFSHNSGDTEYSWSPSTGAFLVNGVSQWTPGGNRVFMTIWDGGGTDEYDLSNYSSSVTVDLRPGEWTRTSSVQLANLGNGNFARGNVANALLFNDDPRSLIENGIGGSGNDSLFANQATNRLTGNGGTDTFIWTSPTYSGVGALADVIADFQPGVDKINLVDIDARSGTSGNDDFSFIGTAAFSGSAGQLRYQVEGSSARVQADTNGDAIADFEIVLSNVTVLGSTDFFL